MIKNKSCGLIINNNHTDIVLNLYDNRVFLVISQYKKFGSLVTVAKENALSQANPINTSQVFDSRVIFGKDEPEIHAAAQYIAEEMNFDSPLLISLCLKDYEVKTLRTIVTAIKEILSEE